MSNAITFTPEAIAAAVKRIVTASKSASRAIETVLVMAVYDSIVNKSPDTANALVGALRASTKQQGIVAFLEKFGQLYDRGGKKRFAHFALGAQAALTWDSDYADQVQEEAQNWESFKPATEKAELDVLKAVEKIIKASKADDAKVVDGELVPYLVALVAQYSAAKALNAAQESAKAATASQASVEVKIAETV